jgi:hypothetical protein
VKPGEANAKIFQVINASTGALVSGLTLSDFTIVHKYVPSGSTTPAAWTHGATITAVSGLAGYYTLNFASPPAAAFWFIYPQPNNTAYIFNPVPGYQAELETQDVDSLYANLIRTTVQDQTKVYLGQPISNAAKVAFRYDVWTFTILQGNNPVDLSGYTNVTLGIRSADQTSIKYNAVTGVGGWTITANNAGLLSITWPEAITNTGTLGGDVYSWLATGKLSAEPLYIEVTGDIGGDTAKTVPIIRSSQMTLLRREVGS